MASVKDLEEKIDLLTLVKTNHKVKKLNNNQYRINPCPVCNHNDHFTVYAETNSYSSFNKCCEGGSVYKYLIEVEGMEEDKVYKKLEELAGESKSEPRQKKKTSIKQTELKPDQDYTTFILNACNNQTEKEIQYFIDRGISADIIKQYKLCIALVQGEKRAVIPTYKKEQVVCYNARAINENQKPKYKKSKGKYTAFNSEYLYTEKEEIIFLTEGEFDALILETLGYKAIALGGINGYNKIAKEIEKKENTYIGAFDNDAAGQAIRAKVNIPHLFIPIKHKDINEWFIADKKEIEKSLKIQLIDIEQIPKKPNNTLYYINNKFNLDINNFSSNKKRKTGFNNLDDELKGLHAGLYVIGGISSVGKTTFAHQIADQIAQQGEHVLYFSLEQSTFELVSKSLARKTKDDNFTGSPESSFNIRCGKTNIDVINAIGEYKKIADKISIIEGNFNTTADSIKTTTEQYINANNIRPVVFIDYLQIVQGDKRLSDKQKIDQNVTALKRMSRDFDITVFVISSLNRGNYLSPIDFESFKESGGIEYTADVVLGLQLKVFEDDMFNNANTKIKEKREKINEAKKASPRKIELICLKNRNGIPYFKCDYSYYPKYDTFSEHIREKKRNKNELKRI
jgi:replicative DNA helicase